MSYMYLLEPLAPLIFRSGKQFGSEVEVDGANFPLPSSSAGLIRTVLADQQQMSFDGDLSELLGTQVGGPLLARFDPDEPELAQLLVPRPADAVCFKDTQLATQVVRLAPKTLSDSVGTDLPAGLSPVQALTNFEGKPTQSLQFWSLSDLMRWQKQDIEFEQLQQNGLDSLPIERRTHVSIDPGSQAHVEGGLFQTAGLDLAAPRLNQRGFSKQRLGFWLSSAAKLNSDLVTFGGERRLSKLQLVELESVKAPADLSSQIKQAGRLKLTLLTPALFSQGSLAGWLDDELTGCIPGTNFKVRLHAMAIERWEPISGFDLKRWKPKVMRKAVAAGSVLWFEILDPQTVTDDALQQLWLKCISDSVQDRLDGFGLVLPAAYSINNKNFL